MKYEFEVKSYKTYQNKTRYFLRLNGRGCGWPYNHAYRGALEKRINELKKNLKRSRRARRDLISSMCKMEYYALYNVIFQDSDITLMENKEARQSFKEYVNWYSKQKFE